MKDVEIKADKRARYDIVVGSDGTTIWYSKAILDCFSIAPRISQKLEETYEEQRKCKCKWNGEDSQTGFEVIHNGVGHAVDLEKKTCSCRSWDLTGIPCAYAMSAILYMKHQPEHYLTHWYTAVIYEKTYQNMLQPVPGKTFWNHEGEGLVLPPNIIKKAPGKKKTARRRDVDETTKGKVKLTERACLPSVQIMENHDITKINVLYLLNKRIDLPSFTSDVHTWPKGRKLGSKNRIGRSIPDLVRAEVPTPSQYLKETRKEHEKIIYAGRGTPTTSTPWLEAIVGRGRARKGKGRGRGTPNWNWSYTWRAGPDFFQWIYKQSTNCDKPRPTLFTANSAGHMCKLT
ncbi:4-hydroxy-tetrahydrodipicolinate reductase, partial [Bienertia sinuspersici]